MEDLPEGECDEERPGTTLHEAMTCFRSQQASGVTHVSSTRLSAHRALFQLSYATRALFSIRPPQ